MIRKAALLLSVLILAWSGVTFAGDPSKTKDAHDSDKNKRVFQLMKPLAEKGDIEAQHTVGLMYEIGFGVEQSYSEAVNWFRKAAAKGNADAQYQLGRYYHGGLGIPRDFAEAERLYRKAAEKDHASAQFNLGIMYKNGQGVLESKFAASDWYYRAGLSYFKQGEKEMALTCVDRIKENTPDSHLAQSLLSVIYEKKPEEKKEQGAK